MSPANQSTNAASALQGSHPPIRIPAFMPENPSIWFHMLEMSFDLDNVNAGHKYAYTVTALPANVLVDIADILEGPT